MKRAFLGLSLLGASFAESAPPKPPPPPPPERVTVEVDDLKLKRDIDDCIRRGVNWLREKQESTGAWPGLDQGTPYGGAKGPTYDRKAELSALALLALLKCEVSPKDTCIERGFAWLRKQTAATQPLDAYSYAVILMALEAKYAPKEALRKSSAKQPPAPVSGISEEDLNWARQMASLIVAKQSAPGGWRYSSVPADMEDNKPGLADVSAAQYALMGLKTAHRMGIPTKIDVFLRASDFLLSQQDKDGKTVLRITERTGKEGEDISVPYGDKCRGFAYMRGNATAHHAQASAGMTCAGLVGMMICRAELKEDKTLKPEERKKRLDVMEQSIYDGLAWLDANWSVTANKPVPTTDYELGYYLYALERVGVMADLRYIGPRHDWYMEGARIWTSRMQEEGKDSGYWALGHARAKAETQDTPYGLLFLRKAAIKIGYPIGGE